MPFTTKPLGINGKLAAYRDALEVLKRCPDQAPQLREDQMTLVRSVYGQQVRGRPITGMEDRQLYCIAQRIHSSATNTVRDARITSLEPEDISAVIRFRDGLKEAIRKECLPPNRRAILKLGRSLERDSELRDVIRDLLKERRKHYPHELPTIEQRPLF